MNCKECGKFTKRSFSGYCQGCYYYFKNGGTVHVLPESGTIERDENGKIICHICGRSYKRLGSHVKESHGMTIEQYKEQFGLCRRTRTTENAYSEKMRNHALINGMDKQLLEKGKNTRVRKGESHLRKNKEVRLQEIIDKKNRKNTKTQF